MNDEIPKPPPIEEVIKQVLLSERGVPDWLENMFVDVSLELTGNYPTTSIEKKPVYTTLWYFSKMTPEEIAALDKSTLGKTLAGLDTEDQDDLVKRLPPDLENDFWDLIRDNDPFEHTDE